MNPSPVLSLTRLELARPLSVRLFRDLGAPVLGHEPVLAADFSDVASEAWRDGCLRAGHPEVGLAQIPMRLSPVLADGPGSRCTGFDVEITLPDGKANDRQFPFSCLRHVADRAAASLLSTGLLNPGESFLYDVIVPPGTPAIEPQTGDCAVTAFSVRTPALTYLDVPLRALLQRAEPIALEDDELPPIFYTAAAFAKAEACARRGSEIQLESGGALFGSLAACRQTGEFIGIIHDVVEIQHAEQTQFSLNYTDRSWSRLMAIQRARQAAFPQRAERLLGQAHGHPFRPIDGKLCAECEKRPVCRLTSAWASQDDQVWHRAVFARQPWAVCHIFGQSARGEPVHQLFGLRNGRLQARGYYLLPDFAFD